MKKKHPGVYLWAPVLLTLSLPQLASAQEDEDSRFEEITVTATKREESIYEVPIAMSAFQGDNLAAQGITDITDIGKFVPNMNVTGFSAGHVSSVNPFIRGIGLQDHLILTDPGVSVYVDGVYLGRQVGQNWSLHNIERRMELYKVVLGTELQTESAATGETGELDVVKAKILEARAKVAMPPKVPNE